MAAHPTPRTIQIISTDFDGTIHSDGEVPPVPHALQETLSSLQSAGARWIINTGRDLSSLMECLARARMSVWPDYLGLVEREIYVRQGHEYHPLQPWNNACTQAHADLFARVRPDIPSLMARIEQQFQATLYEDAFSPLCLIARNNPEADEIMKILEDYCRTIPDLTVIRNDIYARFSHSRYHKGAVLTELSRLLQVDKSTVFAAGDHLNDLPMLDGSAAAMVAAPSNAIPVVKTLIRNQGGYQASLPWGHGVHEALSHFLSSSS